MSESSRVPQPGPSDAAGEDLGEFRGVVLESSTVVEPVPEPPAEPAQPPVPDPTGT